MRAAPDRRAGRRRMFLTDGADRRTLDAMTVTPTDLQTVGHWIAGAPDGDAERFGDVHDPATGQVARRVALASAADVDRAVQRRARRVREPGAPPRSPSAPPSCSPSASCSTRAPDDLARLITAEHGKALDDAARRGAARPRGRRVRLRHPAPAEGRVLRAGLHRRRLHSLRQPLGVVAGITPFNFPAMVPMWMYPLAIACGNTFILKPSEKDPSAVAADRRAARRGRACPTASSTSCTATRSPSTRCSRTPTSPPCRSSARRRSRSTSTRRRPRTASACRRSAARRTTRSSCPTPTSTSPPTAIAAAGVRLAPGSAAWRSRPSSPSATRRDELVAKVVERAASAQGRPRRATPQSEMGPLVTARGARPRRRLRRHAGEEEGATRRARRPRARRSPGTRTASSSARRVLDDVTTEMGVYRDEIFGPVLVVLRAETFDEALDARSTPTRTATAPRSSPATAARRASSSSRVTVGMVGINVPIPVPMAYYSFGGWKDSLFGDLHVHGREGVLFYTRGKVVTERWPQARPTAWITGSPHSPENSAAGGRPGRADPPAPRDAGHPVARQPSQDSSCWADRSSVNAGGTAVAAPPVSLG